MIILPHNLDAEQELLGAMLINNGVVTKVSAFLKADHFYSDAHRAIFEAIRAVMAEGTIANPVTLKAYFERDALLESIGGPAYLARLAATATTVINATDYAKVIVDLAQRREAHAIGQRLAESAIAPEIDSPAPMLIADAMGKLTALAGQGPQPALDNGTVAMQVAEDMTKPLPCYRTGIPALDEAMGGGLYEGKCYGFAARKKVGKTIMLGTISQNLNAAGVKHQFFAMEMSPKEIEQRAIARACGFNSISFLKRDNPRLAERVAQYAHTVPKNVIYEAAAGASLDDLRRMVSTAVVRHGIKGFILDYWQLVGGKPGKETEAYHLGAVAQWIADTCRKHGLFAVVAAQVNQEGNTRGGEGLKLACDQYYTLHREKGEDLAWLEMEESRYTMYQNVGSDIVPGLRLNQHGPHFEDFANPTKPMRAA